MTDLALTTANTVRVVESTVQITLPAAEAIVAGAPVRLDTSTGNFTNANGTTAAEARGIGIATRTVAAGEALTAIKKGVMDGWDLSGAAYDDNIYISDTNGILGDDPLDATVDVIVGRVIPGTSQPIGTANDRLLLVDL